MAGLKEPKCILILPVFIISIFISSIQKKIEKRVEKRLKKM